MQKIWRRIWSWIKRNDVLSVDHLMVCLGVVVLGVMLWLMGSNLGVFSPLKRALEDFSMTDVYFEMQHRSNSVAQDSIVLVDMTELVNRDKIAEVIDDISACGPRVLLVDLIFLYGGMANNPLEDEALVNTVVRTPNVIYSCKLTDYSESKKEFRHVVYSFFKDLPEDLVKLRWGYSNVHEMRSSGIIRNFSLSQRTSDGTMYSLPYYVANMYRGTEPTPTDNEMRMVVYESAPFTELHYSDVKKYPNMLKDKIVLLGTMHEESDMHITPIGKMPGLKVLAHSIRSYMHHPEVKQMSLLGSLIFGFVMAYFSAWMGVMITRRFPNTYLHVIKVFYFAIMALLVWAGFICFVKFSYNLKLIYPLLALALVEESRHLYKWLIAYLSSHDKMKLAKKSIYAVKKK